MSAECEVLSAVEILRDEIGDFSMTKMDC
jgi:hypothetical protein